MSKKFNYGGQAVIEGVMMRGSKALSVAVRNPEGEIVIHTEPLNKAVYGGRLMKTPFARGLVLLWDALGLGMKSLMWSAETAMPEEEKEGGSDAFSKPAQIGTVLLSLLMSIGLFFLLPAFIGDLGWRFFEGRIPYAQTVSHLFEGLVKLAILIGYVWGIGLMDDVKRLYGYHGAEHKTINAYEAGAELTPEIVQTFPIEHPRCGTAFLLTLMLISVLLFSLIDLDTVAGWIQGGTEEITRTSRLIARFITRILLIPVVAGIAYEFIRFSGKHLDNPIVRWITIPNMAMQHLTTKEPDETMLEVAIASFNQMMAYENGDESVANEDITYPASPLYQTYMERNG